AGEDQRAGLCRACATTGAEGDRAGVGEVNGARARGVDGADGAGGGLADLEKAIGAGGAAGVFERAAVEQEVGGDVTASADATVQPTVGELGDFQCAAKDLCRPAVRVGTAKNLRPGADFLQNCITAIRDGSGKVAV